MCDARRQLRHAGELSSQHEQQLSDAGFVWRPDVRDAKWYSNFHLARQWREAHGDISMLVPAPPASTSSAQQGAADHQAAPMQPDSSIEGTAASSIIISSSSNTSTSDSSNEAAGAQWQEVSAWLARQQELYALHKITPPKLKLLRGLGESRQGARPLCICCVHPSQRLPGHGRCGNVLDRRPPPLPAACARPAAVCLTAASPLPPSLLVDCRPEATPTGWAGAIEPASSAAAQPAGAAAQAQAHLRVAGHSVWQAAAGLHPGAERQPAERAAGHGDTAGGGCGRCAAAALLACMSRLPGDHQH